MIKKSRAVAKIVRIRKYGMHGCKHIVKRFQDNDRFTKLNSVEMAPNNNDFWNYVNTNNH